MKFSGASERFPQGQGLIDENLGFYHAQLNPYSTGRMMVVMLVVGFKVSKG